MSGLLQPFHIKDCALAAIATGVKAQTLVEFRDRTATVPLSCIYYHFWGGRLRTSFEFREYHNDFSHWAHHQLHDEVLAERLEILNPMDYRNLEDLRLELMDIIENRIEEQPFVPWVSLENSFHFIGSKIVVFDTRQVADKPEELVHILPQLTRSSLFYHFIDSARRIPEGGDDFSAWLQGDHEKYKSLIEAFRKIDPFLISMTDLQNRLVQIVSEYFLLK